MFHDYRGPGPSGGRLYVESRHLPATQGGGGDIHDVMATPFGVRLLVGDVMGTPRPARGEDGMLSSLGLVDLVDGWC